MYPAAVSTLVLPVAAFAASSSSPTLMTTRDSCWAASRMVPYIGCETALKSTYSLSSFRTSRATTSPSTFTEEHLTSTSRSPRTVSIESIALNIGLVSRSSALLASSQSLTAFASPPSLIDMVRTKSSGRTSPTWLCIGWLSSPTFSSSSSHSARSLPCQPHLSKTLGHLGLNLHPRGRSMALGISPAIVARPCFWSGSGTGTAEMSACVYGCRGSKTTRSVSASSTILPRYMTARRSLTYLATAMSWVMNT